MSKEVPLLEKSGVTIYKLASLANSAKGHYLSAWTDKIWEGKVVITASNQSLRVSLLCADKSSFGSCEITKQWIENVEKCVDSSKGFVLPIIVNSSGTKKEEKLGVVFKDRKDALHFKMCFSELDKKVEREEKILKSRKGNKENEVKHRNPQQEEERRSLLENEEKEDKEQIEEDMKFEVLEDIARDRYARLLNIQRNMSGVNTLFKEIASLEAKQTEAVVTIEDNVEKAAIKVKESKKELIKTKLIQDKNRYQYCKFLCCVFLTLVITVYLIYRTNF